MGEGQEDVAVKALHDAARIGQWLILKNVHLVTSWLPILSQNLLKLDAHEDFRYFTMSTRNIQFVISI